MVCFTYFTVNIWSLRHFLQRTCNFCFIISNTKSSIFIIFQSLSIISFHIKSEPPKSIQLIGLTTQFFSSLSHHLSCQPIHTSFHITVSPLLSMLHRYLLDSVPIHQKRLEKYSWTVIAWSDFHW